jgi:uncharacterized protein YecE (DUF72 family)
LIYIGTSGWQYRHWKGRFYPEDVPQAAWLEFYCERFATVELNNSFYHLPTAAAFRSWRERTPPGFVVAVKASRFLTHVKKLNDPAEPVARFLERARELGPKLGPVLIQLPPRFHAVPERLEETLGLLPASIRVAVEFRDDSWYVDEVRAILERRGAALVLADSPRRRQPFWRTADWGFVRFHEGRATPRPCYGDRALETWAERLASMYDRDEDVFVYFNNDPRGCALRDAGTFARLVEKAGLISTPVSAQVVVS